MSYTQLLTAQEGISVMEEELPSEAQGKPSIPGLGTAAPEQLNSSDPTLPKSLRKSREKPNLLGEIDNYMLQITAAARCSAAKK